MSERVTGYLATRFDDAVEEEITMMYHWGDHMSGWVWFARSVGMILFLGLLVISIELLVRFLRDHPSQAPSDPTAEQVLAERFARGEINETKYRDRLATPHGQVRT